MSQVRSNGKVRGLEEALRELRKIEPETVKQFRRDARAIAKPAIESARGDLEWQSQTRTIAGFRPDRRGGRRANRPANTPLSGMGRGVLIKGRADTKWDFQKAKRGIGFRVGGPPKKRRVNKTYRILSIIQNNPAGAIFDMAGKHGGSFNPKKRFEESLQEVQVPHRSTSGVGPSRYMWPGVEGQLPAMQKEMMVLIRGIEARLNRKLAR